MDRRQDGTAAATTVAAGPVPVPGKSFARRLGHAAEKRWTRRGAADRAPPVSLTRPGTATGAATRDTGSARRRLPRTTDPAPSRPAAESRGGRARNATTEILKR